MTYAQEILISLAVWAAAGAGVGLAIRARYARKRRDR